MANNNAIPNVDPLPEYDRYLDIYYDMTGLKYNHVVVLLEAIVNEELYQKKAKTKTFYYLGIGRIPNKRKEFQQIFRLIPYPSKHQPNGYLSIWKVTKFIGRP